MRNMTPDEWRAFLETGTRTAKVAVVRRDGRPHVVPVWFVLEGASLVFTTWHESVKGRALGRDGRVCLCVDDEQPPFSYVMVEGTAQISQEAEERGRLARRIATRYMGEAQAEAYGARNAVEGEVLVRVPLKHVTALAGIAD